MRAVCTLGFSSETRQSFLWKPVHTGLHSLAHTEPVPPQCCVLMHLLALLPRSCGLTPFSCCVQHLQVAGNRI